MFTTLSPEDMTKDPVFAFNATLPDVAARAHGARAHRLRSRTSVRSTTAGVQLTTDELTGTKQAAMPAAARVEQLARGGDPAVKSRTSSTRRRHRAQVRGRRRRFHGEPRRAVAAGPPKQRR